tara:strand:- start:23817 stop:24278 length:462 start_codon:yes stop_codon:yes gene_type:complete
MVSLFLSTFINKVDRKGRVSVPASFRATLADQSFHGIVVFKSYRQAALEGCGINRMHLLSQQVDDQMDLFSEDQDDMTATLFADAQQLGFDTDGRVMLPEAFRAYANITDSAAFVGRGATFQIWQPDAFKVHQDQARKRLHQRGATLKIKSKD